MNVVVLAGRVADRPFRPGNGDRVVIKLDVDGENPAKTDRIELHCFGAVAERAMRLWQGDLIGIRGRIELRIWTEDGEEYDELRVVAHRVDVMVKGNSQRTGRDGAREGGREGGWQNRDGGREKRDGGWGAGNRDGRENRENRDSNRPNRSGGEWLRPDESIDTIDTNQTIGASRDREDRNTGNIGADRDRDGHHADNSSDDGNNSNRDEFANDHDSM